MFTKISFALGAMLILIGCKSKEMNKYDWLASESAPKNYPMEIIEGSFYCPDGYSLYIPNRKTIHLGWGSPISTHIVGPDKKSLPNKVSITWFSYTENKFYSGTFDLPYDKIVELFKKKHIARSQTVDEYDTITAGVAPGGHVTIWVHGAGDVRFIASYGAEEVEVPWSKMTNNPEGFPRDTYPESYVKDALDEDSYKKLKAKGIPFGLWKQYEQLYTWEPDYAFAGKPENLELAFYNGEQRFLDYEIDHPINDEKLKVKEQPVPKRLALKMENDKQDRFKVRIYFDEKEIFKAFEKLKEIDGEAQELKLQIEVLSDFSAKVFLRNSEYIVELKKIDQKLFRYGKKK